MILETLTAHDEPLVIAGRPLRSRLMVGTGKYRSNQEMVEAIEASGAEVVTVAVRRVDLDRNNEEGVLHHIDPARYLLLPNTAGCYTAAEAVRYERRGKSMSSSPVSFSDVTNSETIIEFLGQ